MDKHRSKRLGRHPGRSRPLTTLVTNAAAALIFVLGAGAAYLLSRAGPEALAATSRVMMTSALAGLLVMAVVAVRLSRTGPDERRGPGRGPDWWPEPSPGPTTDDLDAELVRLIDEERGRRPPPS